MLKDEKVDDFMQQFFKMLPKDLRNYKDELDKNIRAALNSTFSQMDLVTREEFDVQSALLGKTRAMLEELEEKVKELENRTKEKD